METTTTATTTAKPPFTPQPDWTLLSQGAEARIWKIPASDESDVRIAKERFSKKYRHPQLDEKLTKSRCRAEGRILEKCLAAKMQVPKVLRTEPPVLYLEFLEGITVREYLEETVLANIANSTNDENDNGNGDEDTPMKDAPQPLLDESTQKTLDTLATQIGTMVGTLHDLGCIHGDLTTSNMMLRDDHKRTKIEGEEQSTTSHSRLTLIDFGLAKNTTSAEERAVDLYVLERALTSTHPKLPNTFFDTILKAYKVSVNDNGTNDDVKNSNNKAAEATLQRLEQVRLRGRKRECFG